MIPPSHPPLPVQGVPTASRLHSLHAPCPNSSCALTCTTCRVPRQASPMSNHSRVTWSTFFLGGGGRGEDTHGAG